MDLVKIVIFQLAVYSELICSQDSAILCSLGRFAKLTKFEVKLDEPTTEFVPRTSNETHILI